MFSSGLSSRPDPVPHIHWRPADDTRLNKTITCCEDVTVLQNDLLRVIEWASSNNMALHENKFELLSYKTPKSILVRELLFTAHRWRKIFFSGTEEKNSVSIFFRSKLGGALRHLARTEWNTQFPTPSNYRAKLVKGRPAAPVITWQFWVKIINFKSKYWCSDCWVMSKVHCKTKLKLFC